MQIKVYIFFIHVMKSHVIMSFGHVVLVFLLLNLNIFHSFFYRFYC